MNYVNTGSSDATTFVRVLLLINMLALFMGSIFMVIEAKKGDSDQANKQWFGVAQITWVILLFLGYLYTLFS
jgi:hypothetical protein